MGVNSSGSPEDAVGFLHVAVSLKQLRKSYPRVLSIHLSMERRFSFRPIPSNVSWQARYGHSCLAQPAGAGSAISGARTC
jgi:hypothetical protein